MQRPLQHPSSHSSAYGRKPDSPEMRDCITPEKRDQLADFEHLAHDPGQHSTAIAELVPDHPDAIGPHDTSGRGMGGAWLRLQPIATCPHSYGVPNFLRQSRTTLLVSDSSTLSIGVGWQCRQPSQDVLAQHVHCAQQTIVRLGDNISQVAWQHKGSVTTLGPIAYLLCLNSLHQCHF
jgi:hypothetical protein